MKGIFRGRILQKKIFSIFFFSTFFSKIFSQFFSSISISKKSSKKNSFFIFLGKMKAKIFFSKEISRKILFPNEFSHKNKRKKFWMTFLIKMSLLIELLFFLIKNSTWLQMINKFFTFHIIQILTLAC